MLSLMIILIFLFQLKIAVHYHVSQFEVEERKTVLVRKGKYPVGFT